MLWVSKSQRHLSAALAELGFIAGQKLVGRLLKRLGYSLQADAKTRKGTSHPDRNAQFEHINPEVKAFQAAGEPVTLGLYPARNSLATSRMAAVSCAPPLNSRAAPYGVYDVAANDGMDQPRHQPRHRRVCGRTHTAPGWKLAANIGSFVRADLLQRRCRDDTCNVCPCSGCHGYAILAVRKLYAECRWLAALAAEDEQMTAERIGADHLLRLHRQAVEAGWRCRARHRAGVGGVYPYVEAGRGSAEAAATSRQRHSS